MSDKLFNIESMRKIEHAENIISMRNFPVWFSPVTNAYGKEMFLYDIHDEEENPDWASFGMAGGCFVHKGKYHACYIPLKY
tara:strand:+ start:151 stop:393 length:243 start_codon:yes stop_codon:yes gene_type:complete